MKDIQKDLQDEELPEVSEVKEATVEDKLNDKTPKKEKKHHNAKAFFYVIGGFVLIGAIFMILTGAWNPFKSNVVEKEALKIFEESAQKESDLFDKILAEGETREDIDVITNGRYAPDGEMPNGFLVEDYGKSGKSGVLKYTVAKSWNMIDIYNLEWETWYMKNTDYAKEKYNSLKNQGMLEVGKEHEYDVKNGNVFTYTMDNGSMNCFVVRNGSIVYHMYKSVGIQNQPYNKEKAQKWFDDMGIDFVVQDFDK